MANIQLLPVRELRLPCFFFIWHVHICPAPLIDFTELGLGQEAQASIN